jgi:ankyrin repeat protein
MAERKPVEDLADPVAAFLVAACVPRQGGHAEGSLEQAEMILRRYPEVRRASVFAAAVLGDEAGLREFVVEDARSATAKGGPYGWDALTHLCFSRYLRIERQRSEEFLRAARLLLDAGASAATGWYETMEFPAPHLESKSVEFESALYGAAAVAQNAELTRLLLEHGADPNDAETAYHVAESYEHAALRVLLESGKFNAESLVTLLVRKADVHDVAGMRMVLEFGGDPNWTPMWGATALLHALLRDNRVTMMELLLDFGADFAVRSPRYGMTGFEIAARRGRGDVLEMLERRGVELQLGTVDRVIAACARGIRIEGQPAIRKAIAADGGRLLSDFGGNGNALGVKCLLELGARPDAVYGPIGDGYWDLTPESRPLHVAAWRGWPAVVKELIAAGAPVDARDGKGRTVLMLAVKACVASYWMERRTPESVAALLAAGATVDGVKVPCGYEEVDGWLRRYGAAGEAMLKE